MSTLIDKNNLVVTCKHLPISIDAEQLKKEISTIPKDLWGETRSSVHQDVDAVFVKGYPPVQRKPDDVRLILQNLPYLREVIYNTIPGEPYKCVIVKLSPKGYVRMHRDGWIDDAGKKDDEFHQYFNNTIRIHIPVFTNKQTSFFCNGEFFHMAEGEVWAVNNISDHAVINDHANLARIHIIVDKEPVATLLDIISNTPRAEGWKNQDDLARLMQDSSAPQCSPYAQGKPIPLLT